MELNNIEINKEVLNVLPNRERQIIEMLQKVDINPSLSQISKYTGMSVSTVFNIWKKINDKFEVAVELKLIPRDKQFFKEQNP